MNSHVTKIIPRIRPKTPAQYPPSSFIAIMPDVNLNDEVKKRHIVKPVRFYLYEAYIVSLGCLR